MSSKMVPAADHALTCFTKMGTRNAGSVMRSVEEAAMVPHKPNAMPATTSRSTWIKNPGMGKGRTALILTSCVDSLTALNHVLQTCITVRRTTCLMRRPPLCVWMRRIHSWPKDCRRPKMIKSSKFEMDSVDSLCICDYFDILINMQETFFSQNQKAHIYQSFMNIKVLWNAEYFTFSQIDSKLPFC